MASLRWLALRSEGPGAVSLGKERRAWTTPASLMLGGDGGGESGV